MRRALRLGSALASAILVLGACGDTVGTDTTAPAGAPAATETTIPSTTGAVATTAPVTTSAEHDDGAEEDHAMAGDMSAEAHDDSGSSTGDGAAIDRTIEIAMTEFAFSPDAVLIGAGETVRFVVANDGVIEHELRLSNSHRVEEHLAAGHAGHDDDEAGHHDGGDVFVVVPPGETAELILTFPDETGTYTELVCLIEGHYEAGMLGVILYEG